MKPKLLLIAYCCSPEGGSEPAVGWTLARLAAERFDVTVIVEEKKFRHEIDCWLDQHGEVPGLSFAFVPEKWWAHGLWKVGLGYLSYRWWHDRALATAKRLHEHSPFDAVQLGTIIGFREPGRWTELGVPFIWGPVGGTHNYVPAFLPETDFVSRCKERVRSFLNRWQLLKSRRVRRALQDAKVVVAATSQTRNDLASVVSRPIYVVSEITLTDKAVTPVDVSNAHRETLPDGLRILWSGVHEPRKCLSLLLKAVAQLPDDVAVQVRVLGAGPMTEQWQQLAASLGIEDRIEWLGWLPHDEAGSQYLWADVFAFTSVRDTTGTVLLEALDAGVPVVTLDHQGAADVVTDDAGIKVPVTTPDETVARLSWAFVELATDSLVRRTLSDGAIRRAEAYRFEAKREQWAAVWDQALEVDSDDAVRRDNKRLVEEVSA